MKIWPPPQKKKKKKKKKKSVKEYWRLELHVWKFEVLKCLNICEK